MKKAHNIYKSKKLIKISLEYDEDSKIINLITITGDFFLYPEETLDELEVNLIGTKLGKDEIKQKIEKCLNRSEAFGFDSESLTDAILGCLKEEQE
ncbi:MAG: lipoate protein ligase C-terminal domain-containing protein [Nitrososphaeraceae archaeon]|nr:lipoate protein ligase C-terminal domain-containing protein [Nitrososphaeraceae archaeon]